MKFYTSTATNAHIDGVVIYDTMVQADNRQQMYELDKFDHQGGRKKYWCVVANYDPTPMGTVPPYSMVFKTVGPLDLETMFNSFNNKVV